MRFTFSCFFLVFSIFFSSSLINGLDTISPGESLFPNQTLVSKQGKFELGFFSPVNSSNYYVGIWYKTIPVQTVVWVLNRNNPIQSSSLDSCRLQMGSTSLSLIVDSLVTWESVGTLYVTEAVVLDSGNFVLRNTPDILWQSFDFPTDTWLPGAMVGFNMSSDKESKLVSWKSVNDPSIGEYSLGLQPNGGSELFMKRNGKQKLWRSGIWQGGTLPAFSPVSRLYNFSFFSTDDSALLTYSMGNESLVVRVALGYNGVISHFAWSEERQEWILLTYQPSDFCKSYASCGANAVCDIRHSPVCQCLDEFVPQSKGEWDLSDFSRGCRRVTPLQCDEDTTVFLKVANITFPAYAEALEIRRDGVCQLLCRVNCSCTAYANSRGGGCLLFTGDLIDSQSVVNDSGTTLYVRMNSAGDRRPMKGKRNAVIAALVVPISSGIIVLGFCIWYLVWKKFKSKEPKKARKNVLPRDLKTYAPAFNTRTSVRNSQGEDQSDEYELPLFSFASIAASTNNFSSSTKLGEGGFGPVYKAELANEQFVAVKKLSRMSGQGIEEFRNEIELIAKLQHRNLVGILGCCVENEEKILVYEYMPNKSLDSFLFDPIKKARLSWKGRVNIIEGIAQGLLYLHHYSRLRIVHRDLKASNILLDAEMNPKISDFGMARIFSGDDLQANTKRIVGTYGYMSPEYAIEGRFSLKSDVFAFGVLVLEIMSGKKNTDFYGSDYLSLLGYVWNMWKQERALEVVDPVLEILPASSSAALRYIKIGLLCVQENPADRPLMSDVVAMLNNNDTAIASPQNPAFSVGRSLVEAKPTGSKVEISSSNCLTISLMEAR